MLRFRAISRENISENKIIKYLSNFLDWDQDDIETQIEKVYRINIHLQN